MTDLPVSIDATYPDRSAGDALHQQHHDELHDLYNKLAGATPDASAVPGVAGAIIAGAAQTGDAAANNTVVGNGGMPVPVGDVNTAFTGSASITNPDKTFMGALSGFAYYDGSEQVGAGTYQGGAGEAYCAMTGTMTHAALGWEGIATAIGTGIYPQLIGMQGSAQVSETVDVGDLIAVQARAPYSNGGTPTVDNAYAIKAQEPTVGTNRFTYYGPGRHRMVKGTHANVLEIAATSDLLQWASDGSTIKGYASDGASERMVFDPQDGAANRILSNTFSTTTKHLSFLQYSSEVFRVAADGVVALTTTAGFRLVEVGAADSAGTGYRTLRVSN